MIQTQVKRHVKLAKFGCLRCGRFLFAPSWYKLYYNVMVCRCDASHYKTSATNIPVHIQEYWDAQFNTAGHVSYRRRLRRWAKRHPLNEDLCDDASEKWRAFGDANRNENDLRFKAILQFLRSHVPNCPTGPRLLHTLKVRAERTMRRFKSFIHFVKTHDKVEGRFSEDTVKPSVKASSKSR
jgi:hypothetical protein